jgi:DNA (cytosine-5)-methyltransferase 1
MRHGSLFSGIGGFDLAAEWIGWDNKFHCEWNPFGQRVLKHYWPNAESFNDITKTDFKKYANKIDILTGGFPCQPYSSAGKRLGKEDERHLWPEMLRAIREISPSYVVGENVRGLTNWNGGLVFEEVCAELESYGYQVAPCIIPACGVDAPHRRERVWFVAFNTKSSRSTEVGGICEGSDNESIGICAKNGITTNTNGNARRSRSSESGREERQTESNGKSQIYFGAYTNGNEGNVAYTMRKGLQGGQEINRWGKHDQEGSSVKHDFRTNGTSDGRYPRNEWDNFPTQSPICGGDDGLPTELDGITFSKWRNESIKAYGNAIVPQVAYQIFKAIQLTDENTRRKN